MYAHTQWYLEAICTIDSYALLQVMKMDQQQDWVSRFDRGERLRPRENKRLSTSRKVLFILLHGYWTASDT